MVLVVVVPFQNEEVHLPQALRSLDRQSRRPDLLVLADDGSADGSSQIAAEFAAERAYAKVLQRPRRPPERDRLIAGGAVRAFQWAVDHIDIEWDVVAKVDADVALPPVTLAMVEERFEADSELGMTGPCMSEVTQGGEVTRCPSRPEQVMGMATFYRRACYEHITPLPALTGWDTVDTFRAQMRGWKTESFVVPGGDPVHLRPRGSYDGILRGFRRWGTSAYVYGSHPLHVALFGARVMRTHRPYVVGGVNYLLGWARATLWAEPRAEEELREEVRRDQINRIRRRFRARQ